MHAYPHLGGFPCSQAHNLLRSDQLDLKDKLSPIKKNTKKYNILTKISATAPLSKEKGPSEDMIMGVCEGLENFCVMKKICHVRSVSLLGTKVENAGMEVTLALCDKSLFRWRWMSVV